MREWYVLSFRVSYPQAETNTTGLSRGILLQQQKGNRLGANKPELPN